jgi:hypothetical protein
MDSGRAPLRCRLRDAVEVLNTPFRHVQDAWRFPRSERRWLDRIERSLAVRPSPLLVYSAPKTASTSVADAIERMGRHTVIKVHHLQPEFFWPGVASPVANEHGGMRHKAIQQRMTRSWLSRYVGSIRAISLIRDPLGFNVSNFTYFGRGCFLRTCWRSAPWMSSEELYGRFERTFPHEAVDRWWSREFAATTGIDPLREPFDAQRGWHIHRRGRFECLLMRVDLPDMAKVRVLQEFLGVDEQPMLGRLNPNSQQSPPQLGARLREAIGARPDYVDRMLGLSMVRRFWTEAQRSAIRDRWLRGIGR